MCVEPPQKQPPLAEAENENQDGWLKVSYDLEKVTRY